MDDCWPAFEAFAEENYTDGFFLFRVPEDSLFVARWLEGMVKVEWKSPL